MKQKLIIATSALVMMICSAYVVVNKRTATQPINKNINVEVYKTASYLSDAYADTYATLQVTVVKVNGVKRDTAWQHSFAPKALKDFPASNQPMLQQITVSNVNDKKEKLEINYRLTYSTRGSELNFSNTETINKGQQFGKVNIKI